MYPALLLEDCMNSYLDGMCSSFLTLSLVTDSSLRLFPRLRLHARWVAETGGSNTGFAGESGEEFVSTVRQLLVEAESVPI